MSFDAEDYGLRLTLTIPWGGEGASIIPTPADPAILLEDGSSYLLLESGDKLLLE